MHYVRHAVLSVDFWYSDFIRGGGSRSSAESSCRGAFGLDVVVVEWDGISDYMPLSWWHFEGWC